MSNEVRKEHSREKEYIVQALNNQNHLNQREEFRMIPRFLTHITGEKRNIKGKVSFEGKMMNLVLDVV